MPKIRQDAWSHEDDLLLAETVLRHIREGSTQLKAFDEVGDLLNRTSAACGFRWNAEVRQKYEQAVSLAKKQRKEKKREEALQQPVYQTENNRFSYTMEAAEDDTFPASSYTEPAKDTTIDLTKVIHFLKDLQKESSNTAKRQVKQLEEENQKLTEQNRQLNIQLDTMTEDYQALIQIMDRARKMVMFDEQDHSFKPQFRMEKNGNLENIAR